MAETSDPALSQRGGAMGKVQLSRQEKAGRWDELISCLKDPRIRNTHVRHLSAMRRAVNMLLAAREELPVGLVTELKSYMATLDALSLEAVDGFAGVNGILDLLPTYVTESIVGELCQPDTDDD